MKKIIAAIIVSIFLFVGISFAKEQCQQDFECGYGMKCAGPFGNKKCYPK